MKHANLAHVLVFVKSGIPGRYHAVIHRKRKKFKKRGEQPDEWFYTKTYE